MAMPTAVSAFLVLLFLGHPQDQPARGCVDMEAFLLKADIVGALKETPKGITRPRRATLVLGSLKHDAVIQSIDIRKTHFQSDRGGELNFRDFWGFNIAGYELAKQLGLNMVPPYVERRVNGRSSSVSWVIDNVMMDELDRRKKKLDPPPQVREAWNQEMSVLRVFNELIYNTDNNMTNVLIVRDWRVWMIDFTRAFRLHKTLLAPANLGRCDRKMLARLRVLDAKELEEKLVKPQYLSKSELEAVLARRDKIVAFFDGEIARKGEEAILFDLTRSGEPCGAGL